MTSVAVVGAGTAGCAAALLLARDGHRVTLFEQAPEPGPVGAGILLQPTGMEVLERLGVSVPGAQVRRLRCTTAGGRTLLDLSYDVIGAHGLGVHRGALFHALFDPLEPAGVELRLGVRVTEPPAGYDLVVAADGARSALRRDAVVRPYPWGALWFIGERGGLAPDVLDQVVDGTRFLAGVLPTGRAQASLFFSVRADRPRECLTHGLGAWRAELERHPAAAALRAGEGLAGYTRRRRAHVRFYAFASRWMTPFFQSGRDRLAAPRDTLMGPAARVPWIGRQMVRTMAGLMARRRPGT